jgi:hypothetical protein
MRWKPNTLLIADPAALPKIYHLRANKTPHYNHSPSDIKGIVEENDWAIHRSKRARLNPPVSFSLFFFFFRPCSWFLAHRRGPISDFTPTVFPKINS